MNCPRCGRELVQNARFCHYCGRREGYDMPAVAPCPPVRRDEQPAKVVKAALIVAILSGGVFGGILAWDASSNPLFDLQEWDGELSGSDLVATATVQNIGGASGWVTAVCEVSFSDGASFEDSDRTELEPGEVWVFRLVVFLPQAYVLDDSGKFRVFLE